MTDRRTSDASLQNAPDISIIVTIVDGGAVLRRCLDALASQQDAPQNEVIIPHDDTVKEINILATEYPDFRFLDIGRISAKTPRNDLEEHGLIDVRRARGIGAARGSLIGVIEDRGWPRKDWARRMVDLHSRHDHPAIGGPVENAAPDPALSAVFMCDFGRSELPFEPGPREYVTDINICYKAAPLMDIRHLWEERYLEVPVNRALQAGGQTLLLAAEPAVVQQRAPRPLGALLAERYYWGRVFGRVRAADAGLLQTLARLAFIPVLPFVLLWRHLRMHRRKNRTLSAFFRISPYLILLLTCWCFGEGIGYIEGATKNARGGNN
jgi:hypothetical protein